MNDFSININVKSTYRSSGVKYVGSSVNSDGKLARSWSEFSCGL